MGRTDRRSANNASAIRATRVSVRAMAPLLQAQCDAQPFSAHVPGRAIVGWEAVDEFDQIAAPSGIVSRLPRGVTLECRYGFVNPLGFVLADEFVERLGHLGVVWVEGALW